MCTWHLTFDHATELRQLVSAYQAALAPLPGLNPVPLQWLHLTIQGVGYADELPPGQLDDVAESVRRELATMSAFTLTFHRAVIRDEAIALPPTPVEPLHELLTRLRRSIATATDAPVHTGPEQAHGFHPHVTIAYSHTNAVAEPYAGALNNVNESAATVNVAETALIKQERLLEPDWLYRWTTHSIASLSHRTPRD
ncbi:MAG: 2'-5' RNA ligase family protein [Pseudonocardiaceae bacterium]